MPFDHRHYIGGNPLLSSFHDEMIRQYERANRYRYLADFMRELGMWEAQQELLMTAFEATRAAEELHGLFSELCSSRDAFTTVVLWPRPRVRGVEEQLLGVRITEPYYYGEQTF